MSERRREQTLAGWGRLAVPGREIRPEDLRAATADAVLTRGLGRSYGDASLPPPDRPEVVATPRADRILAFDPASGELVAEAGLALSTLNRLLLPRGWFVPVTPGTSQVTLGGMVAADVHGKNHHVAGTIGRHVTRLALRLAPRGGEAGPVVTCSRRERPELFAATLGGMGLTGHILEVGVRLERLPSPWILAETERFSALEPLLEGLGRASREWPFTVAWIDVVASGRGAGRGILHRGRWAFPEEAPAHLPPPHRRRLSVPFEAPSWLLSGPTLGAFNRLHYHRHRRGAHRAVVPPWGFFYPLDAVAHWNRLYGPRGFTQYQCVLPAPGAAGKTRRFLERLRELGGVSFLSVVKDCGEEGEGLLSFPRPGISIALDLPVGPRTQQLVDALNDRLVEEGGRIYLAKDAFTRPEHLRAMEPRLERFLAVRRAHDPEGRIRSAQSVRLLGDPPGPV